jgi:hypothetical protein
MKNLICGSLLVCAMLPAFAQAETHLPREMGKISTKNPAFLALETLRPGEGKSLVISSFNVFGSESVSFVQNIGESLSALDAVRPKMLASGITWPNEARMAPREVFGGNFLLVAGGFLVPGKATGALTLIEIETGATRHLTTPKKGWFYHRAEWLDMNNDGRLDIVTARANKPIFGASEGELVVLTQPADARRGQWYETVLAKGPDVHFRIHDFDKDGKSEIVATQFFSKKLTLFWNEGTELQSRVIDANLGSAFDVEVVDLNKDGKDDLLVTNHESNANAAVLAYEVPADFKKGEFTRHILIKGIETRQGGFNQASPGQAVAFHPETKRTEDKPSIIVAGDGSQRAHLLTPKSSSASDWTYEENVVVNAGSTVGQIAVGDVNNDGFTELFVPAYDKHQITVLTFAQ